MLAVSPDLLDRSAPVNLSVAGDVEVIPDVAEAPVPDVIPATLLKIKALPLGGGRAMNDNQRNSSHRPMHDVMPNTPARAVATATMALSTMPQTDDFFELELLMIMING